jgi:hypothetical protein
MSHIYIPEVGSTFFPSKFTQRHEKKSLQNCDGGSIDDVMRYMYNFNYSVNLIIVCDFLLCKKSPTCYVSMPAA